MLITIYSMLSIYGIARHLTTDPCPYLTAIGLYNLGVQFLWNG